MIIGGNDGTALLNTVELYNWKTKQQCMLRERLPSPISETSGIVLDGVPIFCGGYGKDNEIQKACYKFDPQTRAWENVSYIFSNLVYPITERN